MWLYQFFTLRSKSRVSLPLLLLLPTLSVHAAMVELQEFSFGTFALVDNSVVSQLIIPHTTAAPWKTNKLFILSNGQPGHYQLSGFPANTALNVSIADYFLLLGGGESFRISHFTFDNMISNNDGEALLKVGATLYSSGSGIPYVNGGFLGTMDIIIDF